MTTREEMLEQIRETEQLLREARKALAKFDPPDDELLRMFQVAAECLEELRRSVPRAKRGLDARSRRRGAFMSH